MNKIYVIMGKSATGKDTIFNRLLENKEIKFKRIVLYTTRPMRANEENGREYIFVSNKELNKLIQEDKVIECRTYKTVHGDWSYFTVVEGIDLKRNRYLMIGTIEAYKKIRSFYGEENVEAIFLHVEDGVRLTRALNREKAEEHPKYLEMCRRYLADEQDFSEEKIKELAISKMYSCEDADECINDIIDHIKNNVRY